MSLGTEARAGHQETLSQATQWAQEAGHQVRVQDSRAAEGTLDKRPSWDVGAGDGTVTVTRSCQEIQCLLISDF